MTATTKISYGQALAEAIRMEMFRDPSVVCLTAGGSASRSIVTGELGLAFGRERVVEIDPHARPVSVAVGMAARGLRVVCEARAGQLGQEVLAPLGELDATAKGTVIVRVPEGGPENAEGLTPLAGRLYDTPGLSVLAPATPADAKGMLIGSIRAAGASCLLETEALYGALGDVPEGQHLVESADAAIEVFGERASVFAYGLGSSVARLAISSSGLEVEFVDLRSLRPLDADAIVASVGRTGKAAVVEPPDSTRVSAEIAALLLADAFEYLDGPLAHVDLPNFAGDESRRDEAAARIAARIDELIGY